MRYINNKLTLSEKEKKDMHESLFILHNDQCTRGEYKEDMAAYKGYLVVHELAVQLGVISKSQYLPIKPKK